MTACRKLTQMYILMIVMITLVVMLLAGSRRKSDIQLFARNKIVRKLVERNRWLWVATAARGCFLVAAAANPNLAWTPILSAVPTNTVCWYLAMGTTIATIDRSIAQEQVQSVLLVLMRKEIFHITMHFLRIIQMGIWIIILLMVFNYMEFRIWLQLIYPKIHWQDQRIMALGTCGPFTYMLIISINEILEIQPKRLDFIGKVIKEFI